MIINPEKIILCIIDGFGIGKKNQDNAFYVANAPFLKNAFNKFPTCELSASAEDVGLPKGQAGNSEVGHMTIGAGRKILQDIEQINNVIANNELAKKENIINFIKNIADNKTCHLLGICSDGGVHGHIDHIICLAQLIASYGKKVKLHLFLDGRDVLPKSALYYLTKIEQLISQYPQHINIATIMGRFYAMDRDNRWLRTKKAYDAIILGEGIKDRPYQHLIKEFYGKNISDEIIEPIICNNYHGIEDGDSLLITNYRADRIRQLAYALAQPNFNKFEISKTVKFTDKLAIKNYSDELAKYYNVIFPDKEINSGLAEVISKIGYKQLRIAETEKYPHITYFFNGGKEDKFVGEERIMLPSPNIDFYDQKPEMAAIEITDKILENLNKDYKFILCNFANTDMVGHTGNLSATVKAIEVVDQSINRIFQAIKNENILLVITSDHGNCEEMFDIKNNQPKKSHTNNLVPFILVHKDLQRKDLLLKSGSLKDIAPTLLAFWQITKPQEMDGESLINYEKNI